MTLLLPQNTVPAQVYQASVEDINWGVDFAAVLGSGQSPDSAASTLVAADGTAVALEDEPSATGTVVAQRVRAVLTPGEQYRLTVTCNPSGTTEVFAAYLTIICPP